MTSEVGLPFGRCRKVASPQRPWTSYAASAGRVRSGTTARAATKSARGEDEPREQCDGEPFRRLEHRRQRGDEHGLANAEPDGAMNTTSPAIIASGTPATTEEHALSRGRADGDGEHPDADAVRDVRADRPGARDADPSPGDGTLERRPVDRRHAEVDEPCQNGRGERRSAQGGDADERPGVADAEVGRPRQDRDAQRKPDGGVDCDGDDACGEAPRARNAGGAPDLRLAKSAQTLPGRYLPSCPRR